MHYHFRPEIFVQMNGATRFRFPLEEFLLSPGEIAIVPTGLPHAEQAMAGEDGAPFRNLVVGFCSSSVSMHLAVDSGSGSPVIESIRFHSTPDRRRMIEQAEYIVLLHHSGAAHAGIAVRGLGLGLLAVLADLAHAETPDAHHESPRIFRIKWLVRDQLCNPELNVAFLAQRLECASDYLSHVFHKETGETLIHYIHRQRMTGAIDVLGKHPELTISEIAWACGFVDAGYFTRVFRKHTGLTPLEYRRRAGQDMSGEGAESDLSFQSQAADEISAEVAEVINEAVTVPVSDGRVPRMNCS
jgi:AraC-like DNA-binding protein